MYTYVVYIYIYIYVHTKNQESEKKRVIEGVKERKAYVYPRLRKVKFRNKKIRVVSRDRMFHVQLRRKLQSPFSGPPFFSLQSKFKHSVKKFSSY